MTVIYIDADACPVREEVLRVAARHHVDVVIVSNGGIRPVREPNVEMVIVAEGPDAADQWIVDRIGQGDLCVTGDILLAANCLSSGGAALGHNGELFTQANIGNRLAMRDLMADMRAANPLGMPGGGKPFSKADRSRFLNALENLLRRAKRSN